MIASWDHVTSGRTDSVKCTDATESAKPLNIGEVESIIDFEGAGMGPA
jgi:hypothetical protein